MVFFTGCHRLSSTETKLLPRKSGVPHPTHVNSSHKPSLPSLPACLPWMVTLDGGPKANRTQPIDPGDHSGPKDPSDQCLGPRVHWIRPPRLPQVMESKVNIFWQCSKRVVLATKYSEVTNHLE